MHQVPRVGTMDIGRVDGMGLSVILVLLIWSLECSLEAADVGRASLWDGWLRARRQRHVEEIDGERVSES